MTFMGRHLGTNTQSRTTASLSTFLLGPALILNAQTPHRVFGAGFPRTSNILTPRSKYTLFAAAPTSLCTHSVPHAGHTHTTSHSLLMSLSATHGHKLQGGFIHNTSPLPHSLLSASSSSVKHSSHRLFCRVAKQSRTGRTPTLATISS